MNLIRFFLRNWRVVILILVVIPILTGIQALRTMPKELNPDISIPIALVIVPYPGSSPNQVESLITTKLEDKLKGLNDVDFITSTSAQGSASIGVNFLVGADIDEKIRDVREAVADAESELPDDILDPMVLELNFSETPILVISFSGSDYVGLTKTAKRLQADIENIKDVLSCDIVGGVERQFNVSVDPATLEKYHLTLNAIVGLIASENLEIPGGTLELAGDKYVTQIKGKISDIDELGDLTISGLDGGVIHLRDVAEIVDGKKDPDSYARMNQEPAVTLAIKKRQGTNTLEITENVLNYLESAKSWLPAGSSFAVTGDQAKWIGKSLDQLSTSGLQGLVLVILMLYLFLGLRNAAIASTVLPLTILIAFSLLWMYDISMNSITLFSLVLVIGMIVDNAIVVVENIYRHHGIWKKRYIAALAMGLPTDWDELKANAQRLDTATDEQLLSVEKSKIPNLRIRSYAAAFGTQEVALPILTSTLTTVAAFMPMLIMPGTMGDFLKYIPITVSLSLMASFLVGLVVNPTISSRIMRSPITLKSRQKRNFGVRLTAKIQNLYEPVLRYALSHRKRFLFALIPYVFGAIALIGAGIVPIELFPPDDVGQLMVNIKTPVGSDLSTTDQLSARVEAKLTAEKYKPYFQAFVSSIGGGGPSSFDFTIGTADNFAQIIIDLVDEDDRDKSSDELLEMIREDVKDIAGGEIEPKQIAGGPPSDAPVGLKIIGPEFEVLKQLSQQVQDSLKTIAGAIDIKDDLEEGSPEISFVIDRDKAARRNIGTADIIGTVRTAINGTEATTVRLDDEDIDIVVRLAEKWRDSVEDLGKIAIMNRLNQPVLLSQVADIQVGRGMSAIHHYDGERVVRISANNQPGVSAVEITKKLRKSLDKLSLPTGYKFNYTGDFEQFAESFVALAKAFVIAALLIYLLMVAQFHSFTQPFTIMLTIPLGIFGAIYGLLIGGQPFALVALIAIVGLSGVVVNISIILIDYINKLNSEGVPLTEAIVQASLVRIRPILLTTFTTIIGLLPLTYAEKGWQPMGFSFIFGLGFAMPLTLIIIPIVHSYIEGRRARHKPVG
ncbi:MAG: efflux RND transporter permease subunit [FCB group bacterium]|nr:efflux RND transporter permease subunit [FCB group bacterium]